MLFFPQEKHKVELNEDDCAHLKNCLILLQNILHLPEESDCMAKTSCSSQNWQYLQNKIIWYFFFLNIIF